MSKYCPYHALQGPGKEESLWEGWSPHLPRRQRWPDSHSPACPLARHWSWYGQLQAGVTMSGSPTQGAQQQPCSAPQPWPHSSALTPPPELTDLQLPLYPAFAALPVVTLRRIVLRHDFHELPGQGGVLGVQDRRTGVRPKPRVAQESQRPAAHSRGPAPTCVFRILRSAEDRFRPSSCSMLCSMPGGTDGC